MKHSHFTVALGVVLALGSAPLPTTAQAAALAGSWILNAEDSDDIADRVQGMRRGAGPPGRSGGGRGGARPGGMSGRGGRGESGGSFEGVRFAMEMVMAPAERMHFAYDDSTVTVDLGDRPVLALFSDGRTWTDEVADGVEVEYQAEWRDGRLWLKRKISGGARLEETYVYSERSGQLFVITKFDPPSGRGQTIEFRRVYDRESDN